MSDTQWEKMIVYTGCYHFPKRHCSKWPIGMEGVFNKMLWKNVIAILSFWITLWKKEDNENELRKINTNTTKRRIYLYHLHQYRIQWSLTKIFYNLPHASSSSMVHSGVSIIMFECWYRYTLCVYMSYRFFNVLPRFNVPLGFSHLSETT